MCCTSGVSNILSNVPRVVFVDIYHRVITHRDATDVPTFFVLMLGKLLEFTGIEYASNTQSKMANRLLNLPSMRS